MSASLTNIRMIRQVKSPIQWIIVLENHIPDFSVKRVLKTPCTLIKIPDKTAIKLATLSPPLNPCMSWLV